MTELALIETQKTFLPLMAVQQRNRGVGYDMPVRTHQSAAEATAAGAAARRRLMGGQLAIAARRPAPKPTRYIQNKPMAFAFVDPGYAPVDMLGGTSWEFIIKLVALRHGMKPSDILGRKRTKPYATARHQAIALVYSHGVRSLPRIGRMFGGRDHTTILASLRKSGFKKKQKSISNA